IIISRPTTLMIIRRMELPLTLAATVFDGVA
ncbi:MAG: hypothetical protein ACI90V_009620, partial [Bacillariaceae sp.]